VSKSVLLIEDEPILSKNIRVFLERAGYEALCSATGTQAVQQAATFNPDVVVLDYMLPDISGLEVLTRLREANPQIKVIMMTGHGNIDMAVEAMKSGAIDFLTKPVELARLRLSIEKALDTERMETTLDHYRNRAGSGASIDALVGESSAMLSLKNTLRQLINTERRISGDHFPSVLITGETGTGKELVARALHFEGPRAPQAFVELNCSAMPAQLIESELFGYERGAFTDARTRKIGLAEAAQGGTLFLDEIGDMDLALQSKLLKLLEDKTVRRLGSVRESQVDLRIMAATHRPLEQLVQEQKFRADLFYRLRVVHVQIPALRHRENDVLLLARRFVVEFGKRYDKSGLSLSETAEQKLLNHQWPGNVRELRNVMEQAVLLSHQSEISAKQLPMFDLSPGFNSAAANLNLSELETTSTQSDRGVLHKAERDLLMKALKDAGGNISKASRLLGISRDTLRYRIEKHDL
jgi:two-component system, NtrC family, response regulator AtoC